MPFDYMEEAAVIVELSPNQKPARHTLYSKLLLISQPLGTKNFWISLLLGQLCSVFLCGTAVTSTYLTLKNVNCPTTQSFFNYVLIGTIYGSIFACSPHDDDRVLIALKKRWWKYLLLAVIDVEANYLLVKAYHYTTLTSVQLLDCIVIPVVLILSCLFLRYRFLCIHYFAVLLCVIGAICMVFGDFFTKKSDEEGRNRLLGDFMVFGGSVMYGISNVSEEYIVKKYSRMEFLAMLGLWGTVVGGIQLIILERQDLAMIDWTDWEIIMYLALFALFLFGLYSIVPVLMSRNGATVFNLSILSADFYALIIGLMLFQYEFHFLYFVGFVLVVGGLITYSTRSPVINLERAPNILSSPGQTEVVAAVSSANVDLCSHRMLPPVD